MVTVAIETHGKLLEESLKFYKMIFCRQEKVGYITFKYSNIT